MMKILVACEESQAVCIELRRLWHEAYSCDILPCSWWHPEWHIQWDVLEQLYKWWDMMIAFPPCTYLTNAWMCNLTRKNSDDKYRNNRKKLMTEAFEFVKSLMNAPIEKIAIENPVWYLNTHLRKPEQIIHPYQFGHSVNKKTCLRLKNLPLLVWTKLVEKDTITVWEWTGKKISNWYKNTLKECKWNLKEVSLLRSKTFHWIAKAMAEQWTK